MATTTCAGSNFCMCCQWFHPLHAKSAGVRASVDMHKPSPPLVSAPPLPTYYKALYNFTAEYPEELSLEVSWCFIMFYLICHFIYGRNMVLLNFYIRKLLDRYGGLENTRDM